MKEVFCFIPAKSNSTRIRNKNSKLLAGAPLYYYPIKLAKESKIFNKKEIILSTNSEEIAKNSKKFGAYVPYLRSEDLSKDPAGVIDVLIDFLEKFPQYKLYKYVCILLPTSPLTMPSDIKKCIEEIRKLDCNCLMSVSKTDHNAQLSVKIENGVIKPLFPSKIMSKSTELDSTYHLNGAIHIVRISKMLRELKYVFDPIFPYVMPKDRSVDIDEEIDLQLAEFLLSKKC